MASTKLPIIGTDGNLARYLREIWEFPILAADQAFMLAQRWRAQGDVEAVHKLVTSHLRLVVKIAVG